MQFPNNEIPPLFAIAGGVDAPAVALNLFKSPFSHFMLAVSDINGWDSQTLLNCKVPLSRYLLSKPLLNREKAADLPGQAVFWAHTVRFLHILRTNFFSPKYRSML